MTGQGEKSNILSGLDQLICDFIDAVFEIVHGDTWNDSIDISSLRCHIS